MSIEKKSLISTLKTTKKANVASAPVSPDGVTKSEILKKAPARRSRYASVKHSRYKMPM